MIGYKAFNKDLTCRGFQFYIDGRWHKLENDNPLVLCENGFHFCEQPSGVWAYYSESDTRVFKVDTDIVLEMPSEAGADFKRVCRKIKLLEELTPGGNCNTGDRNTGDQNTGDQNTGDQNTGDQNTGDRNTGNSNTGNYNTGNYNTGHGNTGDQNTGHRNTGDQNTGHGNTGYGNATDKHTGNFCVKPPKPIWFDRVFFGEEPPAYKYTELLSLLGQNTPFDYAEWAWLPNATTKKVKALHEAHIARRGAK
jgi:hypothetical protein